MRLALVILAAALALIAPVASVQAAPDPSDLTGINPYQTYVITRALPNGREVVLATASVNDGWTNTQIILQTALAAARQNRTNNPAWVIFIYGPIDLPSTWYTNDDRIWGSATEQ